MLSLVPPRLPDCQTIIIILDTLREATSSHQLDDIFYSHNFTPSLISKLQPYNPEHIRITIESEITIWHIEWFNFYCRELPILMGNDLLTLRDRAFLAQYPSFLKSLSAIFDLKESVTVEEFLQNYRRRHFTPQCDLYCPKIDYNIERAITCGNRDYVLSHLEQMVDRPDDIRKWICLALDRQMQDLADSMLGILQRHTDPFGDFLSYISCNGDVGFLQYLIGYLGDKFPNYLKTRYLRIAAGWGNSKVLKVFLLERQHQPDFKEKLLKLALGSSTVHIVQLMELYLEFMDLDDIYLFLSRMQTYNRQILDIILTSGKIEDPKSLRALDISARTLNYIKKHFRRMRENSSGQE